MSRLQQIQITTQQTAEAIASVLGMDVTIVDEQLVRIAATGLHERSLGQKITVNSVYEKVINGGEEYIIADVSKHDDCGSCDNRKNCQELAQLCCPIFLGQQVIGVIGLVAFSREQQLEMVNKGKRLLQFIRKMAELVAAKAAEKDGLNHTLFLKNQVETVLHFVAEGIIAIDHTAKIININQAAEKMLNVKANDVKGFNLGEVFPGSPIPDVLRDGVGFINREVSFWNNGTQYHYFVNAKTMISGDSIQGVVASFRPVGEGTNQLMATQKNKMKFTFAQIVGSSASIEAVKSEAQKAAANSSTVMILGESGTGKELFARAIHCHSRRSDKPFIAINCAAIPENLLESELFGYEEGSFTGAKKGGKPGKFQLANGGTLFLDEIGDMPLSLQAKILRAIQEKEIERIGAIEPQAIDVRIIVATHRNLEELVMQEQFREDLYYRLNVFPILLPALRNRQQDIIELAEYFLTRHAKNYGKGVIGFTAQAGKALQKYAWPGNIRELENALECAVIRMSGQVIDLPDLPSKIRSEQPVSEMKGVTGELPEISAIRQALGKFGTSVPDKVKAAESLGISIATLYRKINKYHLS